MRDGMTEHITKIRGAPPALDAPTPGGNILPEQVCPCWQPRTTVMMAAFRECWNCRYADFHLDRSRALDVGVCEYPNVKI